MVASDGQIYNPLRTQIISNSTAILELPVENWSPDVYDVRASKDGSAAELHDVFTVVQGSQANLVTHLVVPRSVSAAYPVKQTVWVEYSNTGNVAMPAPLLQVSVNGHGLITTSSEEDDALRNTEGPPPSNLSGSVQILGTGSGATPGLLRPGDSLRVPIYYVGLSLDKGVGGVTFSLGSLTAADTTEYVCYLTNPDERVVYKRPRTGEPIPTPPPTVWPYVAKRANSTGILLTADTANGGGTGYSEAVLGAEN